MISSQSASARQLGLPVPLAWARWGAWNTFQEKQIDLFRCEQWFLNCQTFQFNKMFQESIILEPVRSALGRRGGLITLRCSEQKQQSRVLASQHPRLVGGPRALLQVR